MDKATIMIGLLGEKPKMAEKKEGGLLESDVSACPLATQDTVVNAGNKRKAEVEADYKENPVAKCMDCEYFCTAKEMPTCGIKKDMGFCKKFEFVCNKSNGCNEFEVATEEEEYEDD